MLLTINNFIESAKFYSFRIHFYRLILCLICTQSSISAFSQEYNLYIRNYEDKLFFVSIDSVKQAIYPRWGFQIIKVQPFAKKLSVTNEQNKTTEISLDTSIQEDMFYEVFMDKNSLSIKRSDKTWTVKSLSNEPFVVFKPSQYNKSKIPERKLCELQYSAMDLMFLNARKLPKEEDRLEFLLKNISKNCLRVNNVLYFSQLFDSEPIKLAWLQNIYLQTVDQDNFRNLSKIFKSPAYKENFHVWLNLITDK